MMLLRVSNRMLVAFLIAADAAIFAGGAWLERFSLSAAADPRSSALLILTLLLANLALLVLLFGAVGAASIGAARLCRTISRLFADIGHRSFYGVTSDARPERDSGILAAERRASRRV